MDLIPRSKMAATQTHWPIVMPRADFFRESGWFFFYKIELEYYRRPTTVLSNPFFDSRFCHQAIWNGPIPAIPNKHANYHSAVLTAILTKHYSDVIMGAIASQITSLTIVYSTVYAGTDQRKHLSSASLAVGVGNSPGTGEFSAQMASNAENVSIWWRHHDLESRTKFHLILLVMVKLLLAILQLFMNNMHLTHWGLIKFVEIFSHDIFIYISSWMAPIIVI